MTPYQIPLTAQPQKFVINLAGTAYTLRVGWNTVSNVWVLDILNDDGTQFIAAGIPLITGVDLLGQLTYLNIKGQLRAQTTADITKPPTYDNLGSEGFLYFVVED